LAKEAPIRTRLLVSLIHKASYPIHFLSSIIRCNGYRRMAKLLSYGGRRSRSEIWSRVVDEKVRAFPLASFFGGCKDTDPFEIVDCRPATEILFPAFLLRGEFLCVAEVISGRGLLKFTVDEPSALHHQLDLLVPREPPPGFFRFESKLEDHRQGRHS